MKLRKSLKLALNILRNSKLRSRLTIIGITIGVALLIFILTLSSGTKVLVNNFAEIQQKQFIEISEGYSHPLDKRDIIAIKKLDNVIDVFGSVKGSFKVEYLNKEMSARTVGLTANAWKYLLEEGSINAGRKLTPVDTYSIIVKKNFMIEEYSDETSINQGYPSFINQQITINEKIFRVVGILDEENFEGTGLKEFKYNEVFMPIDTFRKIEKIKGEDRTVDITRQIMMQLDGHREDDSTENEEQIKIQGFDKLFVVLNKIDEDSYNITTQQIKKELLKVKGISESQENEFFYMSESFDLQGIMDDFINTITMIFGAIAVISIIAGALGITNTIFTSVTEKTKEIGIMKSLGAKNRDIMMIFLWNAGLIGLAGGIGGLLLLIIGSILGLAVLYSYFPFAFEIFLETIIFETGRMSLASFIDVRMIIEVLFYIFLLGMISGVIPAYRASKLKPVDALRYE